MRVPSTILAAGAAVLLGVVRPAATAGDYTYLIEGHVRGSGGGTSHGLATGVLVLEQKPLRPIAWFGAAKPADGKSRFLYLLIFKTPADYEARTFGVSGGGNSSSETGAEGRAEARLNGKTVVEVAY